MASAEDTLGSPKIGAVASSSKELNKQKRTVSDKKLSGSSDTHIILESGCRTKNWEKLHEIINEVEAICQRRKILAKVKSKSRDTCEL